MPDGASPRERRKLVLIAVSPFRIKFKSKDGEVTSKDEVLFQPIPADDFFLFSSKLFFVILSLVSMLAVKFCCIRKVSHYRKRNISLRFTSICWHCGSFPAISVLLRNSTDDTKCLFFFLKTRMDHIHRHIFSLFIPSKERFLFLSIIFCDLESIFSDLDTVKYLYLHCQLIYEVNFFASILLIVWIKYL